LAKDPAVDLVQKEARSMFSHRRRYVTHDQFDRLTERVEAMEASQAQNQASIDAETAKVDANQAKLVTVQQEIDALKAQPNAQSLDFSKLDRLHSSSPEDGRSLSRRARGREAAGLPQLPQRRPRPAPVFRARVLRVVPGQLSLASERAQGDRLKRA
jgi:hypothetical protein